MVAQLPSPDQTPLKGTHLEVVVCQLRFEPHPAVSDIEAGLALQQKLGGRQGPYRHLEPQEMRTAVMEFTPTGLSNASTEPSRGWRLRSAAGDWIISLMPDLASIETSTYSTWRGDFRDRLEALLNALNETITPRAQQRLGLRYVNRLPMPENATAADWETRVAPEFLGPLSHPALKDGILSVQQQAEIQIDDRIQCVVRQGMLREPMALKANSYLLDFDLFSAETELFDPSSALALADSLNISA